MTLRLLINLFIKQFFYKLIVLSNKENHLTIKLAIIEAIKKNIPCNNTLCQHKWYYEDLISGNGFQRVRECQNDQWKPYAMIDKH